MHDTVILLQAPRAGKANNVSSVPVLLKTGSHELLCEMSLAELRERLARLKVEEQREQEKRRQRILEEKQSKEQLLLEQLDTITACRTAAGQAAFQK